MRRYRRRQRITEATGSRNFHHRRNPFDIDMVMQSIQRPYLRNVFENLAGGRYFDHSVDLRQHQSSSNMIRFSVAIGQRLKGSGGRTVSGARLTHKRDVNLLKDNVEEAVREVFGNVDIKFVDESDEVFVGQDHPMGMAEEVYVTAVLTGLVRESRKKTKFHQSSLNEVVSNIDYDEVYQYELLFNTAERRDDYVDILDEMMLSRSRTQNEQEHILQTMLQELQPNEIQDFAYKFIESRAADNRIRNKFYDAQNADKREMRRFVFNLVSDGYLKIKRLYNKLLPYVSLLSGRRIVEQLLIDFGA